MKPDVKRFLIAGLVTLAGLWSATAEGATAYVNATVQGALAPGVYGRIEVGNAPPPPLIHAQPIIIQRAPVLVQPPPLYLHVPPGHAKKWARHCAEYNACGRPVYFVKVRGDDVYELHRGKDKRKGRGKGHNNGRNGD